MNDIAKMIAIAKKFGGGSSGSSEVVILPETVTTVDDGRALITTPLQAPVADGDTVSITYNGTAYECTGTSVEGMGVAFGNLAAVSEMYTGNPDAPFVAILVPEGAEHDDNGTIIVHYGMVMPLDGSTTITLSIVQVGAASGGGSASAGGGGVFIVNGSASFSETGSEISGTFDKTIAEIQEAHLAGKIVQLRLYFTNTDATMLMMASMEQSGMIIWQGIVETMIVALFPVEDGVLQGQRIQLATLDA